MFRFIKQTFISALMYFGNLSGVNPVKCISMKNQECKTRPEIIGVNSNNPVFCPFSIKTSKCSGNCNIISDPYARTSVPDIVKNLNIKVFNLMTLTNETRHIKWHESCKCIYRLHKINCDSKQRWKKDKCRCECKELFDKGVCDKVYVWNPSSCECECDKSCGISEYLDYSDCRCRKKLVDPLAEKCSEYIDEAKLVNTTVENENNDRCNSYVVYKVLFLIFFIISIGIIIYFVYHNYVNDNKYDLPY